MTRCSSLRSADSDWGLLTVLIVLGLGVAGCSGPRMAQEKAAARMRALGTWEYQTTGIGMLQRGTLQITMHDGELSGQLQDQWRGRVTAQVRLRGTRMDLVLDHLRITGEVANGRFRGTAQRPEWDASRASPRQDESGYFVARRIRRDAGYHSEDLRCSSLLRETSYACSPLLPE